MRKSIVAIMVALLSVSLSAKEIDLSKSKGTNQEVIVSLSPAPAEDSVKRGANIKLMFDKKLKARSTKRAISLKYLGCKQEKKEILKQRRDRGIQKCKTRYTHNRHLKKECIQCTRELFRYQKRKTCKKRDIQGRVRYFKNRDTLVFNPKRNLRPGYYKVLAKGLKTVDNKKIKKIMYKFEISKNNIENITLTPSEIKLEEGKTSKLQLQVTYHDNTTEDISKDIHWIVADKNIIMIDKDGNLQALKIGETLIQAAYHGKVSKEVKVTITKKAEVINGYILPPEPDPKVNNATLLGVDSNNNGVRDDVERYIIKRYKDHHKIVTEIGFQLTRAYKQALETGAGASQNDRFILDALDCNIYFKRSAKTFGDPVVIDHMIGINYNILNTKLRKEIYREYDRQFSGGVYELTPYDKRKSKCSANVISALGGQ